MTEERILTKIAELFFIYCLSQSDIAKKLGFSKARVSRLIQEAKNRKIVEFNIKSNFFNKRASELERRLEQKYNLREAIIYFDSDINNPDIEMIFKEVGLAGANYIERIIESNLNIALTWGKTIYHAIENLKIEKQYNNINIFATLGGVSLTRTEEQNNNLVQMLADKVGGKGYPIYLPLILEKPKHRDLIEQENNIYKILGTTSKIDYLIAGAGPISEQSRLYIHQGIDKEFLKTLNNKGIVGEICFNFYDINGNFVKTDFEDQFVNLPLNEIKQIKHKVVVAFGKEKIETLKGFLKTNIADVFITDSITAQMILDNEL